MLSGTSCFIAMRRENKYNIRVLRDEREDSAMKISAAFRDGMKAYTGHFGATLKFLVVEGCMTLAAFTPLLTSIDSMICFTSL